MPPSTIPSTSSATSSPGRRFGSSDRRRWRNGAAQPTRHDDSPRSCISARTLNLTVPSDQLGLALLPQQQLAAELGREAVAPCRLDQKPGAAALPALVMSPRLTLVPLDDTTASAGGINEVARPGLPVLTVQIREDRRIRITSVAVSAVAGSTVVRCPAIRRVDSCVVAVSVVGRSVVAISGAIVSVVTVWNASGQTRYQSNDYRQVFEHRRLRSAKVTRRIELRTLCKFESGASVPRSLRLLGLAIAEGRLASLSVIPAVTVILSIVAVPVMVTGVGRRAIRVPVPPLV